MSDMRNSTENHSSENTIQALMNAARSMQVNADYLKKNVETIIASCYIQGTKGEAHNNLLLKRAGGMKILAGLYMSIVKRYEHAAMKLAEGTPEDKVFNELNSYNVCISDRSDLNRNAMSKSLMCSRLALAIF